MTNFNKGFLAILGSVFCFSIIEVAGSLVYQGGADPLTLLTMRFLLASILLFLTIFIFKKEFFKVEKQDIKLFLLSSILLTIHLLAFWVGLKTLSHIATTLAIFFTFPFWVVILSILFLKESFNRRRIISLIMGSVGVMFAIKFLPTFTLETVNLFGIGLMFIAAIVWAIYMLVNQKLLKKYHSFTILFYNFVFCFIVYAILQNPLVTIEQLTLPIFYYILLIAVCSTYLAYILFQIAIKYIKASNTGIVNLSKPAISIFLAFLVLGQTVTLFQVLGVSLIFCGIYILTNKSTKNG